MIKTIIKHISKGHILTKKTIGGELIFRKAKLSSGKQVILCIENPNHPGFQCMYRIIEFCQIDLIKRVLMFNTVSVI